MQYKPYLWPNRRNFRVIYEIGVEEHDGDVRFFTGSGNAAVSRMRNASGHNYWNSSFIMDVAMGQIPRSTERISSLISLPANSRAAILIPTSRSHSHGIPMGEMIPIPDVHR